MMKPPKVFQVSKWRLLDEAVKEVREFFKDVPPDELQRVIDEAVASVRANKRSGSPLKTRRQPRS
jgi:hypothetical protein